MTSGPTISFAAGDLASGGGVNRVIRDLSSIFAEHLNAKVAVFGVGSTEQSTYPFPEKVAVRRVPEGGLVGLWKVVRSIRQARPDFAIGSWTQSNIALTVGLLLSRTKVIAVEHASWHFHPRWLRALRRLVYPLAWRVIVLNPREMAYYSRYLRNLRFIANPLVGMPIQTVAEREKLVLAIGHLEPHKNFIDAVRAMAISRLEESGWELAIIGSGSQEQLLRDAIRDAGLVRTSIHPPTADIASWYNRASLLVLPSKLDLAPLVLAEAMSAGVVPLAYAVDGARFILEEFEEQIVAIGNVDALAERLRQFASGGVEESLRARMRASIQRRFSLEAVARKWSELFKEAG